MDTRTGFQQSRRFQPARASLRGGLDVAPEEPIGIRGIGIRGSRLPIALDLRLQSPGPLFLDQWLELGVGNFTWRRCTVARGCDQRPERVSPMPAQGERMWQPDIQRKQATGVDLPSFPPTTTPLDPTTTTDGGRGRQRADCQVSTTTTPRHAARETSAPTGAVTGDAPTCDTSPQERRPTANGGVSVDPTATTPAPRRSQRTPPGIPIFHRSQ